MRLIYARKRQRIISPLTAFQLLRRG
jgi:hypothetical protein